MIFLDNSSSSFFKPLSVVKAVENTIQLIPFNASRSGHSGAIKAGMLVYNTRKRLGEFFNCPTDGVIFTSGCTEALNLALLGSVKKNGHVITTPFEHNSVLRPLYHLTQEKNVKLSFVTSPAAAAAAVKPSTCLIAVNHVSNVTGAVSDVYGYGNVAKNNGIPLLVDGAQSVGHIKIDVQKMNISLLAVAPHKGLHAIAGVGALIVNGATLLPIKFGGTGTASSMPIQPNDMPEGFEAGTLPLPAIASVNAALVHTAAHFDEYSTKITELSSHLIDGLKSPRVKLYSQPNPCGIVAFNIDGYTSSEAADVLSEQYNIAVRGGFHCAPLAHEYHGCKNGMIRISIGCTNTYSEINFALNAIREMCGN